MLEIAAVQSIIATTTTAAVNLIDKIADSYLKFRGKSDAAERFGAEITASKDNKNLLMLLHGSEIQRVTYQELMARLDESDVAYIRALEKSMNIHKTIWEEAYPALASEPNPVTKAKIRIQVDDVAKDLGNDLAKILDFVEKIGLDLHDHYNAMRSIAEGKR